MSTQPTQPVMDFDALVDLLERRIWDYRGASNGCRILSADLTDDVARAAWGIHWVAAEIGKVTP